jgi:hypothetical protein
MGGSYFCLNEAGRKVAIFKPCDEEPLAPNNPKGYVGRNLGDPGWKPTVRVGEVRAPRGRCGAAGWAHGASCLGSSQGAAPSAAAHAMLRARPRPLPPQAALREVAAYLLDHAHFARVPHTTLVRASHPAFHYAHAAHLAAPPPPPCGAGPGCGACGDENGGAGAAADDGDAAAAAAAGGALPPKLGSLQEFVVHMADTSELGAGRLSKRGVHRIGILDVRLFNTDRHAGNILVCAPGSGGASAGSGGDAKDAAGAGAGPSRLRAGSGVGGGGLAPPGVPAPYELVPIDHGFCLPDSLEAPYFEWLHWPQAMLPFEQEELEYIAALDASSDVALLRSELPALRPQCLRVLQVGTLFLQRCAAAGLTLAAIGGLMSRPLDALDGDDECPSELERACVAARMAVDTAALVRRRSGSLGGASGGSVAGLALPEEDEEEGVTGSGEEEEDEVELEGGPAGGGAAVASAGARGRDDGAAAGAARRGGGPAGLGARDSGSGGAAAAAAGGLMFDLEGEACDAGSVGSLAGGAPQSPFSQASVDSLGSGSGSGLGGGGGGGGGGSGLPGAPLRNASEGGADGGPGGVARSVFGGGFMWRPPKPAGGRPRARSPRRALGRRGAAYPPPVVAAPPRPAAEALSGLGDDAWADFVRELGAVIDDALRSGAWSAAAAGPVSVAMSCPRF